MLQDANRKQGRDVTHSFKRHHRRTSEETGG